MRIRRSRLTRDFLQVPNATVRDERLSYMARGILVDLLSRPDGHEASADDLWQASAARHGKASPGRRQFRAAFAELKEHGYLTAVREPLGSGKHGTVLLLTDVPHGGTSVRPADMRETTRSTDVPDGGTSGRPAETNESPGDTDVPDGGTSGRPAETGESPGDTDVPDGGTSARPAETNESPGRTDVPHGGTSKREDVSKNTGKKKTRKNTGGDGRRPTTGSGGGPAGGSAALQDEFADEVDVAAIGCVIGLLPTWLRDQLPERLPQSIPDTIRAELARGITVDQLVDRAGRRLVEHGYESDAWSADGPGILRPVAVAVALLRAGQCTSPRCDDGTDLDTGQVCRTCQREAEERRAAQEGPVQGAFLTPVPSGADEPPASRHRPAPRRPQLPLQNCDNCDRAHRAATPGELCADCLREVSGA